LLLLVAKTGDFELALAMICHCLVLRCDDLEGVSGCREG